MSTTDNSSPSYDYIPGLFPDWFTAQRLKNDQHIIHADGTPFALDGRAGDVHSKRIVVDCVNSVRETIASVGSPKQLKRCLVDIYGDGDGTPERKAELENLASSIVIYLCDSLRLDATLVGYPRDTYIGADGTARTTKHIEIWNPILRTKDSAWTY